MNSNLEQLINDGRIKSKPVFEVDGLSYYEFGDNGVKMSQARFEAFGDVLSKHEAFSTTKDDVQAFLSVIKEKIRTAKINAVSDGEKAFDELEKATALITNFESRQELGNPLERSLELASFLYIREDENPYTYNEEINREKIVAWKKKADEILPLIMEKQLPNFLMWSQYFQVSFLNSMRGNMNESLMILMNHLALSNSEDQEKGMNGIIGYRVATLNSLIDYVNSALKITTDMRATKLPKGNGKKKNEEKVNHNGEGMET